MFAGPASLKAEWLSAWDERKQQGLADVDLPKAYGRGWYVAGTWLVTGEDKDDEVRPRRPFLQKGVGAFELAARYERFTLGSVDDAGEPPFANPRAANLLPNRDDVVTLGVTWYLNRWIRLQGNAIREAFDDVERAPITGRAKYWSYVGRFQFVL
jgi:phosphate-selective porin OprO/OprP